MSSQNTKIVIIDSFALIFRAYYAYPPTLTLADGTQINAVYGFASLFLDVLLKFKPTHVIAVYESETPTVRASEFSEYKANRKETDNELIAQIPLVKKLLESFDVPVINVNGYEADDVVGTLAKQFDGHEIIIVTGDQDLFQLVKSNTSVYLAGRSFSESKLYKSAEVFSKLGITPSQVTDYKALCGDPSDNIPGVKGIGKTTAQKLIAEYESIENIYSKIDDIKGTVQKKLVDGYDMALKSKQLATIICDVPLSFRLEKGLFKTIDVNHIKKVFAEYRFKSLEKKLDAVISNTDIKEIKGNSPQNYFEQRLSKKTKMPNLANLDVVYVCFESLDSHPLKMDIKDLFISTDEAELYLVDCLSFAQNLSQLKKNDLKIYCNNAKELMHFFENNGLVLAAKTKIYDIGYMVQILSKGLHGHSLQDIFNYIDAPFQPSKLEEAVVILPEIVNELRKEFAGNDKLQNVFLLESSLIPVVVSMERSGIVLDTKKLSEFGQVLQKIKEKLQQDIYKLVGHEFNINSPKQVSQVLFVEKGLSSKRKTKGGALSTNERELKKLIDLDPVVKKVLDYREVDKLLSTYVNALPQFVNTDGKVHAIFDQMGAVSGRFSSKNPNMQNIPLGQAYGINIRDAFVAEKGELLISFDYSQQELRILAALANEEVMIKAFNNGEDIHKITAASLFGKSLDKVSDKERSIGKTVNFSIIYGISGFGLAERLRLPKSKAQEFIDKFYEKYSAIYNYLEEQKQLVSQIRCAETIMGRQRQNNLIKSGQWFVKSAAERELINFRIQGSAADLIKQAMVRIFEDVMPKFPNSKLLAQIHDELLFSISEENNKEITNFIKSISNTMQSVLDIGVEYKVEFKIGTKWGSLKKVEKS